MATRDDGEHLYQDCRDDCCMRFGCRAYKAGWLDGYLQGCLETEADAFAKGFDAGSADGGGRAK